jgi:hypothetical protein
MFWPTQRRFSLEATLAAHFDRLPRAAMRAAKTRPGCLVNKPLAPRIVSTCTPSLLFCLANQWFLD